MKKYYLIVPSMKSMFLYEEILSDCTVDEVNVFVEKCKEANCYPYLESYLEYKAF